MGNPRYDVKSIFTRLLPDFALDEVSTREFDWPVEAVLTMTTLIQGFCFCCRVNIGVCYLSSRCSDLLL